MPRILLLLFCFLLATGRPAHATSAPLRAGFASADITPPVPYRMSGYFFERPSTGKHDALRAKVMVLRQGREAAALVFCDLSYVPRSMTDRARREAARRTGIPFDHILVCATHTHTGPLYHGLLRDLFHQRSEALHGSDPLEKENYTDRLVEAIAAAVMDADRKAEPVVMRSGTAHEATLSFNRRFHMRDGTVRFNPGKMNPDIVKVAGPIDPQVGLLAFQPSGKNTPAALLTVFALHLDTVGGTEYSADYPYYLEEELRRRVDPGLMSMFGNGTCGDINHIDVANRLPQHGHAEAERIGLALAGTVAAAMPGMRSEEASLRVKSRTISFPKQEYTAEQLRLARERVEQVGNPALAFLTQVEACRILNLERLGKGPLKMEVQVFRIGDRTAIVTLAGEVFVEHGLAIKRASPFPNTLVIELSNDLVNYVPTEKAYREGSYEVVNSLLKPGGGEALVRAAIELLRELKSSQ